MNVPEAPAFGREKFQHQIKPIFEDIAFDDTYSLNTQSGTQWDGFRHVGAERPSIESISDLNLGWTYREQDFL